MGSPEWLVFKEYLRNRRDELNSTLLSNLLMDARMDSALKGQIKLYNELIEFSDRLKDFKSLEELRRS